MSNTQHEFKYKITVIGDPAVGKTTLIKKYTTGAFQKEYIATLGAQFSQYEETVNDTKVHLIIWDIAGQETFNIMRRKFYSGTSGAIIVFSHGPGEQKSIDHIDTWFKEIKKYCGEVPIALFGNKIDLVDENILDKNKKSIDSYLKNHDYQGYFETSALTGQGVTEAFKMLIEKLCKIYKL